MRLAFLSFILTTATVASGSSAVPDDEGYQQIPLIHHAEVDVSLLLRPRASAADEAFIGFLIDNKTGGLTQLGSSANFRIDKARLLDRKTGQPLAETSLASGNDYDLLYRDVMVINTERPTIPKGELRRMEALSSQTLGALRVPARGANGLTIKASVHLNLSINGQFPSTPPEGMPIQFDWLPPDDADIARMQARLRQILHDGDPGARLYGVLMTHLEHPDIGPKTSTSDLIAGLRTWGQHGGLILAYLDKHRAPDEDLLDYALAIIAQRDHLRILVLSQSESLHDARLIEPLKAWATDDSQPYGSESALVLLSKQIDLAPDRAALTSTLGSAWLARSPLTRSGTFDADEAWRWQSEVRNLALTRDPKLVPALVPYLDRKDVVVDAKLMSIPNDGVSTRACDIAYNTVMDLLGRDGERLGLFTGRFDSIIRRDVNAEYKRRDALIQALKQDIAR